VCKFSVACNRFFKQDDETQKEVSFFDVSCWTRLAEVCSEYLKKGRGVRVVGRLKQDRWTDADGKDGAAGAAEAPAEVADDQAPEETKLKEAASFGDQWTRSKGCPEPRAPLQLLKAAG